MVGGQRAICLFSPCTTVVYVYKKAGKVTVVVMSVLATFAHKSVRCLCACMQTVEEEDFSGREREQEVLRVCFLSLG